MCVSLGFACSTGGPVRLPGPCALLPVTCGVRRWAGPRDYCGAPAVWEPRLCRDAGMCESEPLCQRRVEERCPPAVRGEPPGCRCSTRGHGHLQVRAGARWRVGRVLESHSAQAVWRRAAVEGAAWDRDRRGRVQSWSVFTFAGWHREGLALGQVSQREVCLCSSRGRKPESLLCWPSRPQPARLLLLSAAYGRPSECLVRKGFQKVRQRTMNTVLNTHRLHGCSVLSP